MISGRFFLKDFIWNLQKMAYFMSKFSLFYSISKKVWTFNNKWYNNQLFFENFLNNILDFLVFIFKNYLFYLSILRAKRRHEVRLVNSPFLRNTVS
jgi:hypothetical protein